MNETERIKQFNAQLDAMMNPVPADSGDDELLGIAFQLLEADFSSESRIRDSLRTRLLDPAARKNGGQTMLDVQRRHYRTAAVFAAVVLALIIATLTIPPLKALAEEVLRQIGFITITNAPSDAQLQLTHTPVPFTPTFLPTLDVSEAYATFGHTIYEPAYLPSGYASVSLTATKSSVSSMYQQNDASCCRMLWLQQFRTAAGGPSEFGVGDTPIVDVKIGDLPGVWVQDAPLGGGNGTVQLANLLTWEDEGNIFWLESFSVSDDERLPLEEMLKVAEALQPNE